MDNADEKNIPKIEEQLTQEEKRLLFYSLYDKNIQKTTKLNIRKYLKNIFSLILIKR